MPKLRTAESIASRGRCIGCFRPNADCFCEAIPRIDNQTEVLILQHRRERFHPFNTARMVHTALRNSSLLVDHTPGLAARLSLRPRAGLLYPGTDAILLDDLSPQDRPEQLVVVDGTWHHAKTVVRDLHPLRSLPRYRLAPAEPSHYRVRREPSAVFLSTVEATVAALRALEPETRGLDQLLAAFDRMVERQLAHPKVASGWRRNAARTPGARNIPTALLGDLDHVVVAYGESSAGERGCKKGVRRPVYWVAQRLGTGERFAQAIQPQVPLAESVLDHMQLAPKDFHRALSLDEARRAWAEFQRPGDILAVYNHSTARLLAQIVGRHIPCLILKAIDFNPLRRYSTLDEIVQSEGLTVPPVEHPGRAGKRLASVIALVGHLRATSMTRAN